MSTVSIHPVDASADASRYLATSGACQGVGATAGQALDALTSQHPEIAADSLVVIQRFRADRYFAAHQVNRLRELMGQWRDARDEGRSLSQAELEQLIEAEIHASSERARRPRRSWADESLVFSGLTPRFPSVRVLPRSGSCLQFPFRNYKSCQNIMHHMSPLNAGQTLVEPLVRECQTFVIDPQVM